jgi:chlorite dismutase
MSTVFDPASVAEGVPPVPLTVEGASVLHQMLRVRWPEWKAATANKRSAAVDEAAKAIAEMEANKDSASALFSLIGHKGDLMLVHFRRSFDDLNDAELRLARTALFDYLEPTTSYLSVIELGLYESTGKAYRDLVEQGIQPHSPEWNSRIEETLERQRAAMAPRLYPEMPDAKFCCFYPMNRRRGESKNWYQLPIAERARQMKEHGLVGRRYAGEVKQIISGSIGFDDWEWGVDLFADDPLVFKKLIYEMRFDEVSAVYAEFGSFYVGRRWKAGDMPALLAV